MRVFVTGASGHLGSAVVPDLLANGHAVIGLARSDAAAARLTAAGAEVLRGDLADLDRLRAGAEASDGVVHLAFRHDAMQSGDLAGAAESDLAALRAIGDALAGTDKPLVGTSGTGLLGQAGLDRTGTEADTLPGGYRIDAENYVIDLAGKGIRSSVVRLPIVHSDLDLTGFPRSLVGFAREHGVAAYIDAGTNRWPAVHTLDAAALYRLALESAPPATRLHAVAEEGVEFRRIAEAIAHGTGVPTRSVTAQEAPRYLGFLAHFVALDHPASSTRTQALLNWTPTHPTFLEDLATPHYFTVTS
ncbi:nucleoside-diphosphate-sugar epimerase [Kribbella amoyensis]|uniref:Nucleoside-diphosphate-sugar epimerase n=1 Tax=Kribbella amoyensis TaxID=996641 RepID=A0A561B3M2_9ACTN|nr:SDR family oxidoreductase [Kribbella amoyensis]TWD73465.1 nucleoside-diphosphate-sugar epimerase [Kribbella amoyensis]